MIRFRCPNCQREYVLADAMYGLPLVCKGCGQPLKVPPPGTDELPDSAPAAHDIAPPIADVIPSVAHAAGSDKPAVAHAAGSDKPAVAHAAGSDKPAGAHAAGSDKSQTILSPEAWAKLDAPPPPAPPEPKPWGAVSAVPTPAPTPRARGKTLGLVVDIAVVLVLVVLGAFLGEFLTRKSTAQVLEGLAAAKFPPTDLLLWLAGPVVLLLIYALLGTRGKTVGGWLWRRMSQ